MRTTNSIDGHTDPRVSQESAFPCNLCGSRKVAVLSLRDRRRRYLRTVICKACGLIWCDPRPATEELRNFYATSYRQAYKGICRPRAKHILRDAREALRRHDFLAGILRRDDPVLDIGAGTGVFVRVLHELGYPRVAGIEPDEHYAAFALEELRVRLENCFLQDFQSTERFRVATMHHVLEHFPDPLAALRQLRELLRPHGFLALEVPNALDMQQDPHNRYHSAHLYSFTQETLEWLGRKAGFVPVILRSAPLHGNITALFQRKEAYGAEWELSGGNNNYAMTMAALHGHTTLRHFASRAPYRKFLGNTIKAITEKIEAAFAGTPEEIVKSIVRKKLEWQCPVEATD